MVNPRVCELLVYCHISICVAFRICSLQLIYLFLSPGCSIFFSSFPLNISLGKFSFTQLTYFAAEPLWPSLSVFPVGWTIPSGIWSLFNLVLIWQYFLQFFNTAHPSSKHHISISLPLPTSLFHPLNRPLCSPISVLLLSTALVQFLPS